MITTKDILDFLDCNAPISDACEWDNCGLLCGDKTQKVKKVMLCLDITKAVVKDAIDSGCELIISHHPLIFSPLRSIEKDSVLYDLIKAGISAICMHTNLDIAQDFGVNETLAKALSLNSTVLYKDDFLCVGKLQNPMDSESFANYVKKHLNCKGVRYTNGSDISTVAVSSGAGSDAVEKMLDYNIDALVTGEIKHHHFLYANEHSLCVVEAGHFNTEVIVTDSLKALLKSRFSDIEFVKSKAECDPVSFA